MDFTFSCNHLVVVTKWIAIMYLLTRRKLNYVGVVGLWYLVLTTNNFKPTKFWQRISQQSSTSTLSNSSLRLFADIPAYWYCFEQNAPSHPFASRFTRATSSNNHQDVHQLPHPFRSLSPQNNLLYFPLHQARLRRPHNLDHVTHLPPTTATTAAATTPPPYPPPPRHSPTWKSKPNS